MRRMSTVGAAIIVAALIMGADQPSCGKEMTATPIPHHVLIVRGFAAPHAGQILISLSGFALDSKGKPALMAGDPRFPFEGATRNPFVHSLEYTPGINLTVTIVVTAAEPNLVVGCEIIDRGISVSRDQKDIPTDVEGKAGAATAVCGPYTTASM